MYDRLYDQFTPYNGNLCRVLGAMLSEPPRRVVELGCGTGLFAAALDQVLTPELFLGLDPSAVMTAHARRRLDAGRSEIHTAPAEELPAIMGNRQPDLVFIKSAYHHFSASLPVPTLRAMLPSSGALAIIERTPKSAASFPLFPEGSDLWAGFFESIARERRTLFPDIRAFVTYGEHVQIDRSSYLEGLVAGQLSFIWPFQEALVATWAEEAARAWPEALTVYEEFSITLFSGSA